MSEARTRNIRVNGNGFPIHWWDCDHCMGVATVEIRNNPSKSLKEMQDYHDDGHMGVIISIKGG